MIQLLNSITQVASDKDMSDNLIELVEGNGKKDSSEQGSQDFLSMLFGETAEGDESKVVLADAKKTPAINVNSQVPDPELAEEIVVEIKPDKKNSPQQTENVKSLIAENPKQEFVKNQNIKFNSAEEFVQNKAVVQNAKDSQQSEVKLAMELEKSKVLENKKLVTPVPNSYKNAFAQNDSKLINANKVLGQNELKSNLMEKAPANPEAELAVSLASSPPVTETVESSLTESNDNFISRLEGLTKTTAEVKPQVMVSETKVPSAVLNMADLEKTPTQNLIEKISNYFEQEQVMKAEKIDLVVKHDELGKFNIQVNKAVRGSDIVDVRVQSMSPESQKFFQEHERELLQSMSKNGVKVGEFKLMAQADTPSSQDRQSDRQGTAKNFDFNQQQDEEQKDSQRRRAMWKFYQDGLAA
jgi:hypothetical protein